MARVFIALIFLVTAQSVWAQVEGEEELRFTVDTPVTLDFGEPEEEEAPKKKKKVKKKVFYGVKTKKGFTRKGFGDRTVYEVFYHLKKSETPQTFARDIYFYDFARKEIRKSSKFDPKKGVLLHGPYEKRQGTALLEKGIYFKGTKHGRWMTYTRDSVLVNKAKYFKGWPKESQVTYYDPTERKRMKEMMPIEFGEREGYYYYFYDNGQLAIQGEYHWDKKVGDWTEYYPSGRRKRIIAYPSDKNVFDKDFQPYIKAEWSDKGKEIYRNTKMASVK